MLHRVRDVVEPAVGGVVARVLPGDRSVDRVVDVVRPLTSQADAVHVARDGEHRVVGFALGDEQERATEMRGQVVDRHAELGEEGRRAVVDERVDGVETQPVDVMVSQPVARVVDEEPTHLCASLAVEVHRGTPRSAMGLGEVRTELGEIGAFGSEVVVDDVEHHREAASVRRVDESVEAFRAPVRMVGSEEVDAVVAPATVAGKLRDGHQLDDRHSEVDEVVKVRHDAVERPLLRERTHMQLVDDRAREVDAVPVRVGPPEGRRIPQPRGAVDAPWLRAGPRVGTGSAAVDAECVVSAEWER